MRPGSVSILLAAAFLTACASGYEFRSDDRPEYSKSVSVDRLDNMRMQGAAILDVRLREDFEADPVLIPNAYYRNPEQIESWARTMTPAARPVVVYCVRGKWVSQKAAQYLDDRGFDVYILDGGIEAWQNAGRQTDSAFSQ